MVVVGIPGFYHFLGTLVEVPESGEVDADDKVGEAMKASGFRGKQGRPASKDKAPE